MFRGFVFLILLSLPAVANASITSANLNCRQQATTSSSVVMQIPSGTKIKKILEQVSGWSKVEHRSRSCWVSSRYLVDEATYASMASRSSYRTPKQSTPKSSFYRGSSNGKSKSSSSSRRGSTFDSGRCPCSGPNICIGPRGGRYCITSGGNKRYGV